MSKFLYALAAIAAFVIILKAYGSAEYKRGWSEGKLEAAQQFMIGKKDLDAIADDKPDDAMLIMQLRTGEFFSTDP